MLNLTHVLARALPVGHVEVPGGRIDRDLPLLGVGSVLETLDEAACDVGVGLLVVMLSIPMLLSMGSVDMMNMLGVACVCEGERDHEKMSIV